MNYTGSRVWLLLIMLLIFAGGVLSGCQRKTESNASDEKMAVLLFSRSGITGVQHYKSETAIHGPTYYYFRTSQDGTQRLADWLGLKQQKSIPDIFANEIKDTITKTKWNFNFGRSQVYLAYYCHPFDGSNWSLDLLLIDNGNAIYFTEGYIPQNALKTDDPAKCNNR